jgi:hypothetical protein
MANAKRDANRVTTILGTSTTDGLTPLAIGAFSIPNVNPLAVSLVDSGGLPITPGVLSVAPLNGQVKMDGSIDQLPANTLLNGVVVTAKSTNAAPIVIGGSGVTNVTDGTGNGYILEAGASMSWAIKNTNALYAIGTSADVLSFAGS